MGDSVVFITVGSMTFMEIVWNNPVSLRTRTFETRSIIRPILAMRWADSSLPMGSGEPPLLPAYEALNAPPGHRLVTKIFHECNYFQANEGNLDPSHVSFLHRQSNVPQNLKRTVKGTDGKLPLALYATDPAPEIETEETDFGIRIFSIRKTDEDRTFFRVTNFILPNLATIPGPMSGDRLQSLLARADRRYPPLALRHRFRRSAPMDEKTFRETKRFSMSLRRTINRFATFQPLSARSRIDEELELLRHGTNLQRSGYRHRRGCGPITDRTQEFLGPADKAIIAARRMVLRPFAISTPAASRRTLSVAPRQIGFRTL